MFSLEDKLTFININHDYLKYLYKYCPEVYYKPIGYDNKPYIGILLNENNQQYVIPLSSAKEKHKSWKNIESDRFLIYEKADNKVLSSSAICKEMPDGKHRTLAFCYRFKENDSHKKWIIYKSQFSSFLNRF